MSDLVSRVERMSTKEAIEILKANYPDACFERLREAVDMAISALWTQEAKTQLPAEGTTPKVKKTCITCKHYPPESKWPCIDCDMRNPADRWESQEVKHSTESSLTQKGLDTISRQAAIEALQGRR